VGPGQLHQIPRLLNEIAADGKQRLEVSLGRRDGPRDEIERSFESYDPARDPEMRPSPYQAFVRIQIGCDKFCTYCIVPSVRGPEQGRDPRHIVAESRKLAAEGCREITLLGQTVNSYKFPHGDGRVTRLSDLLAELHEIDGLERLKFVTNYPKDMTDDLLHAVRDLPKCSPYLHVPAQSGSDAVLKRMKRGYTVGEYREMMARIRATIPGSAVTSDFIVGFSGETEDDFAQTVQLVRDCRFKNSFIFKYSERPGTKGAELLPDDIPDDVKRRRNSELLAIQNEVCEEENERFLGNTVKILVEGPSKVALRQAEQSPSHQTGSSPLEESATAEPQLLQLAADKHPHDHPHDPGLHHVHRELDRHVLQLVGRTKCDRIVVFDGNPRLTGQTVEVAIYDSNAHTLFGAVVTHHVTPELYALT